MYPQIIQAYSDSDRQVYLDTHFPKHTSPRYFYEIRPLNTSITIEQIRELQQFLITNKPSCVIVFYDFDLATTEAQNALLKTFEDNVHAAHYILFVKQFEAVIPTIRSRSTIIPSSQNQIITEIPIDEILNMPGYSMFSAPQVQIKTTEEAQLFIRGVLTYIHRKTPSNSKGYVAIAKRAFETLALLVSNNTNPQLAVDMFLLFAKKNV